MTNADQLTLPLDVPVTERDYHAHEPWKDSVLCRACRLSLWHPIHGLAPGEIEGIRERVESMTYQGRVK